MDAGVGYFAKAEQPPKLRSETKDTVQHIDSSAKKFGVLDRSLFSKPVPLGLLAGIC